MEATQVVASKCRSGPHSARRGRTLKQSSTGVRRGLAPRRKAHPQGSFLSARPRREPWPQITSGVKRLAQNRTTPRPLVGGGGTRPTETHISASGECPISAGKPKKKGGAARESSQIGFAPGQSKSSGWEDIGQARGMQRRRVPSAEELIAQTRMTGSDTEL